MQIFDTCIGAPCFETFVKDENVAKKFTETALLGLNSVNRQQMKEKNQIEEPQLEGTEI